MNRQEPRILSRSNSKMATVLPALVLAACVLLSAADPVPPCRSPAAPTFESMCSTTLYSFGDLSIKQYGLPKTETLVTSHVAGREFYVDALNAGAQYVIDYFIGNNDEHRESFVRSFTFLACFHEKQN